MTTMEEAYKNREIVQPNPEFKHCVINVERLNAALESKNMTVGMLAFQSELTKFKTKHILEGRVKCPRIDDIETMCRVLEINSDLVIDRKLEKRVRRWRRKPGVIKQEDKKFVFDRDKLLAYMVQKGKLADRLAVDSGVTKSNIHLIKSGKTRNPNKDTVEKLAEALDVNVSDLMKEEVSRPSKIKRLKIFRPMKNAKKFRALIRELNKTMSFAQMEAEIGVDDAVIGRLARGHLDRIRQSNYEKLNEYFFKKKKVKPDYGTYYRWLLGAAIVVLIGVSIWSNLK